ncbi:hypothetical protein E4U42_006206 [Claviceps africana]|uniref:GH16 domain-containing protein n=1 Tax=Claviceps africana TaxID=83212 RepID=A0A8K0NFV9_9HYPO|nr:hypothetical protein E4U42_006206 [Claviceps africana]
MVNYHFLSSILLAFAAAVDANAPNYPGFRLQWQDNFAGPKGASPGGNWVRINKFLNVNNELQTYSASTRNVMLSGGNTLQIVPWRDGSAIKGWTSGRLESTYLVTPQPGKITRVEASIRYGSNSGGAKKGIFPAFWMLGASLRHGTSWPACGEIDIMEELNGQLTGRGTVHCQQSPGGICGEPSGLGAGVGIPNNAFHVWRVEFDRRSNDWRQQKLTWFLDGRLFHQIAGSRIGNAAVWATLCQSPLYFVLNVAVGGTTPGNPTGATQDGFGAMMEVAYVAHYTN